MVKKIADVMEQRQVIFLWGVFNLNNSKIVLLQSQTTVIKGDAHFPILEIAKVIPASQKFAFTFTLCILPSHNENL